ncbi:4-amino-4-deoxy-L-arabinose-phosphoundecaprenol flippase subunit ArnE [Escherichia coli]
MSETGNLLCGDKQTAQTYRAVAGTGAGLSGSCHGALVLVLQNVPVGIAYPMLSLNFVWVTLAAVKLWHEPVSPRHSCGVAFIIGGIVILGSTV